MITETSTCIVQPKPDAEIEKILLAYTDSERRFKKDFYELIPTWEFDGIGKAKWLSVVGNSLYGAVISALLETGSVGQGLVVALPCIAVGRHYFIQFMVEFATFLSKQ